MDKSNGKDWLSKTINNVTEESAKVYTIYTQKLEVSTLKKALSEKHTRLLSKLNNYIQSEKVDKNLFQPEYDDIRSIKEQIHQLNNYSKNIKDNSKLHLNQISDTLSDMKKYGSNIFDKIFNKK